MSSEMYSTGPGILAALATGFSPWMVVFRPKEQVFVVFPAVGWGALGFACLLTLFAVSICWSMQGWDLIKITTIMIAVGVLAGLIGWVWRGAIPVACGHGVFLAVLIGIAVYASVRARKDASK